MCHDPHVQTTLRPSKNPASPPWSSVLCSLRELPGHWRDTLLLHLSRTLSPGPHLIIPLGLCFNPPLFWPLCLMALPPAPSSWLHAPLPFLFCFCTLASTLHHSYTLCLLVADCQLGYVLLEGRGFPRYSPWYPGLWSLSLIYKHFQANVTGENENHSVASALTLLKLWKSTPFGRIFPVYFHQRKK